MLAPVWGVLEGCKVDTGTKERYTMGATSRAGVDHSGLVFGCGCLEERRQEQLREVEGTWLQKALKMGAVVLAVGKSLPSVLVPQVMSYPSTVTCSIGVAMMPLYRKVGST